VTKTGTLASFLPMPITPPSPQWIEFLKVLFGYCLLFVLASLVALIALGKVEEKTSYGLMPLVVSLSTLGGVWANGTFRGGKE